MSDQIRQRNRRRVLASPAVVRRRLARVVRLVLPPMARSPQFWLTAAMVVVGAILHYVGPIAVISEEAPFHLTRHTMNGVLFMLPAVYAGFTFGPRGGFATLLVVSLLMLLRAWQSPAPADTVVEVVSTDLVSGLIILWFRGQQQEKARRLELVSRLELARQELASQVEVIKKSEQRQSAINEVCSTVTRSLALPELLDRILDKVVEEMEVAAAMIFLRDEATRGLRLVAHEGVSEGFARALSHLQLGEGFNGRVADTGEAMVVENASLDTRLSVPQVREEGLHSQLIVPLQSRGTTIGTLCVAVRSSRAFTTDDRDLLTAIGSQVGIAIENARLYREALASEQKYRDLFDNATVAIFVADLDGTITAANKACLPLTGYAPADELIGSDVRRLFPAPALALLGEVQQALLQGLTPDQPFDIHLLRQDGALSILSMTTRLVYEAGQPRGYQHIAIDVTERRRMQEALSYYMRQVLTAQEEERKRLARELHDETGQSLLLILRRIDSLATDLASGLAKGATAELENLRDLVLQALAELRRATRDLRPQILDDLGLVAAVEWLAEDMEHQSGIKSQVEVVGLERALKPESQLLLFRVAQQALSNVRRHSGASQVWAQLEFTDGRVRVSVVDNGHGFRVPASLSEFASFGRLGLLGMIERMRLVGGTLAIESAPGKGTRVVAELDA